MRSASWRFSWLTNRDRLQTLSTTSYRTVPTARLTLIRRMSKPESQAIYARRKTIVKPVFGQIKNSGFRGFGVRGKAKVAGEFSLVCVAHNLKKIMLAALRGQVCPEFGKRAAWA